MRIQMQPCSHDSPLNPHTFSHPHYLCTVAGLSVVEAADKVLAEHMLRCAYKSVVAAVDSAEDKFPVEGKAGKDPFAQEKREFLKEKKETQRFCEMLLVVGAAYVPPVNPAVIVHEGTADITSVHWRWRQFLSAKVPSSPSIVYLLPPPLPSPHTLRSTIRCR